MASPFANLGLGALGQDTRYINTPVDTPGWLQGAINVPAAYAAHEWAQPAAEWLGKKLGIVPPVSNNGLAQQYEMYKNPNAISSMQPVPPTTSSAVAGAPVDTTADHELLEGVTTDNPWKTH